jgi:AcrR family transcriptional regulator
MDDEAVRRFPADGLLDGRIDRPVRRGVVSGGVKTSRPYRSAARKAAALQTRRAIIASAGELFLERGFSATTVPAIAEHAGVSVQTVYKVFGTKAKLAKAVFDVTIAGDDEPVPMAERTELTRVRNEPDPRRRMVLYGRFLATASPRHVPLQLVIREAAATDDDAAAVWDTLQRERLEGMTRFAEHLRAEGQLKRGVSVREARDVLWTLNSAETYQLLVLSRGWSPRRYGTWVAHQLIAALVSPAP